MMEMETLDIGRAIFTQINSPLFFPVEVAWHFFNVITA
jgi:hypothetical protein